MYFSRMIRTLFTLLFSLMVYQAGAQYQIGDAQIPTGGKAGHLDDDDLETLKASTTVFVLQSKDEDRAGDFAKSIADVWKLTPFIVASPKELYKYTGLKYAIFSFGGFIVSTSHSSSTHLSYDLTIPKVNRHGEITGRKMLARFILSPDFETIEAINRPAAPFSGKKGREEKEENQANTLYNHARYSNWGPGQIRGYLKAINDGLTNAERRGLFDGIKESDLMKPLTKDTLYLPMYLKDHFNAFNGNETTKDEDGDDEAAGEAYPYPHRYINENELEKMLVNATKPVYHLIYVRSSTNKYVSIVEAKSGTIIYSNFKNMSYNFKMKDLKQIAKYLD